MIVAFIGVGILLGPGLGFIEADTPESLLLAELGITLLLFLVGLGARPSAHPPGGAGGAGDRSRTGGVHLGVGFFIVLGLGYELIAAVYVAVALTFSSTIIIVKLLTDKRETDSTHGRIAIGFLIVQDIVVVIALIALAALGDPTVEGGVAGQLGVTFARGAGIAERGRTHPLGHPVADRPHCPLRRAAGAVRHRLGRGARRRR